MKPTTSRAHLVRATLESLAFRTRQLHACAVAETNYEFHTISLDGGVSNNDFIAQLIADLTGLRAERPPHVEMSSLGCAHIVGLHLGIWKSREELKANRKLGRVFKPRSHVRKAYEATFARWEEAVTRLCGWYTDNKPQTSAVTDSSSNSVTPQNSFKLSTELPKKPKRFSK
ncbi:hypothetical protein JYU34_014525 [Plutella xylostella]|uniref:Carbohydrate kinase FGGY C-terminal domain-containing protein n=1 Tax=Plutella xylostella TaxID=51655 RepID=A0ABQ7Q8J8_PLUXY|nr:hypothetical protein JYU34_014525 [Plutella xylostella]